MPLPGFVAPTFTAEQKGDYSPEMQAKIEEVKKELKKFTDERATVKKDGVMIEEWLFWDNQTYMNQIGLGK